VKKPRKTESQILQLLAMRRYVLDRAREIAQQIGERVRVLVRDEQVFGAIDKPVRLCRENRVLRFLGEKGNGNTAPGRESPVSERD
jgi:hypothetical protein